MQNLSPTIGPFQILPLDLRAPGLADPLPNYLATSQESVCASRPKGHKLHNQLTLSKYNNQ